MADVETTTDSEASGSPALARNAQWKRWSRPTMAFGLFCVAAIALGCVAWAKGGTQRDADASGDIVMLDALALPESGAVSRVNVVPSVYSGTQLFMTMDTASACGVGESTDTRNRNAIEVGSFHLLSEMGPEGVPVFSGLMVDKSIDSASPPSLLCLARGTVIREVRITGWDQRIARAALDLRLTNVKLASYELAVARNGASNQIVFGSFERLTMSYSRRLADGTSAPEVKVCYDTRLASAC